MLGRSSAKTSKAEIRKAENTAARAEHREQLKAAQPPPMIKEIHEMRDNGDEAAGAFLGKWYNYLVKRRSAYWIVGSSREWW